MLRKQARIRIDDFAQTAGVSKQFISDLERGKSTVQMGKALDILARMGLQVTVQVPVLAEKALALELECTKALTERAPGAETPTSPAGRAPSKRGTQG